MIGIALSVYLLVKAIIAFIEENITGGILLLLTAVGAFAIGVLVIKRLYRKKDGEERKPDADAPMEPPRKTVICPNCGAAAFVRGKMWECGWCGDFGRLR